jgi:hypothetical protein
LFPEGGGGGFFGGNLYFVGAEEAVGVGGFLSAAERHDEGNRDPMMHKAFDEAIAGHAQAARNTGWKLPT